jgi:nucleotide-binding universal stress UspA family protein
MNILVAVDLSEPEAFIRATERLAYSLGAHILVLHVTSQAPPPYMLPVDPMMGFGGFAPYTLYDPELYQEAEAAEDNAFHLFLSRFKRPVRAAVREGSAAERILEDAGERKADMIVLGKRHHGTIERLLLGSVASAVVRDATLPVLLIPVLEAEPRP